MGEEVRMSDEDRVLEWEDGLPNSTDLTPLTQNLIPPGLASAFSITSEPFRSMLDVNRASQKTMSSLRRHNSVPSSTTNLKFFTSCSEQEVGLVVEGDAHDPGTPTKDGSESRKTRRIMENIEEGEAEADADSSAAVAMRAEDSNNGTSSKRARLVWTPQLHKRFVDVVAHLGIKNAVPKTIMQFMNVEGLTRENVASHLQKYRLYLKRMQGLSNEGPSASDPLFASTPVPQSLHEPASGNGHNMPPPTQTMPYGAAPQMLPMPVHGMVHGHMGMPGGASYPGFEYNYNPYGMYREQQRDWSCNQFGPMMSYPHAANEK